METVHSSAPKWKILRCFPRFALEIPVSLSGARLAQPMIGQMVDIGLGGMCVSVSGNAPLPGERVTLEFTLPDAGQPTRILSKVRYNNSNRLGFQFLNITPSQRELIRRSCSDLPIV